MLDFFGKIVTIAELIYRVFDLSFKVVSSIKKSIFMLKNQKPGENITNEEDGREVERHV